MSDGRSLDTDAEAEFFAGLAYSERFFMGQANVHRAVEKLSRCLEEAAIPYAIIGGMALNEYGRRRATEDVDVLLTPEGLARFKERYLGLGYVEKFAGSKGLRDTENEVPIDVVLTGEYPGDGLPKSVVFPDPADVAEAGARIRLLPLHRFIELKLASGITAAHRIQDIADVLALIRAKGLPVELARRLDPMVRAKYEELWATAQIDDPE